MALKRIERHPTAVVSHFQTSSAFARGNRTTVKLLKSTGPGPGRDGCHWQEEGNTGSMALSLCLIGREHFSGGGGTVPVEPTSPIHCLISPDRFPLAGLTRTRVLPGPTQHKGAQYENSWKNQQINRGFYGGSAYL